MDQKALSAIAALYNSFPAQNEDTELRLKTMAAVLTDISTAAICEAARRFVSGEVKDQSMRFAPSVPEFVAEARSRQEIIELRARPKLPPPEPKDEQPRKRVSPEAMQALTDALAGKRTIESVQEEFCRKTSAE